MNYVHPLFLKAHSAASKLDNPSWKEATRGKFADEYWKAMELEIATLEAEVIALAACMRELIPTMDMVQLLAVAVGIPAGDVNMRVSVHEDNSGALVLAETLPPQFTPRSKYYATKTIWFCEEINKRGIKLLKIETSEQLGDMFTKGLAKTRFEYL